MEPLLLKIDGFSNLVLSLDYLIGWLIDVSRDDEEDPSEWLEDLKEEEDLEDDEEDNKAIGGVRVAIRFESSPDFGQISSIESTWSEKISNSNLIRQVSKPIIVSVDFK